MTISEMRDLIFKAIDKTLFCTDNQFEYMGCSYIIRTYINDGLSLSFWNPTHMVRIMIKHTTIGRDKDYITYGDDSITLISKKNSNTININTNTYNIEPSEEEEFEINLLYDEDINLAYNILKETKKYLDNFDLSIYFKKLKKSNSIIDLESIDYHLFEKLIDASCKE